MSGWIKLEKDRRDDPRVIRMARQLRNAGVTHERFTSNVYVTLVLGGLDQLWCYADTHIRQDDTLELGVDEIDQLVGVKGFCTILPRDWLEVIDEENVKLPAFHAHNGTESKRRALTQKRVENHRALIVTQERNDEQRTSVTDTLPDQTKTRLRPRPEENIAASPLRAGRPRKVSRETDINDEGMALIKAAYPERAGDYRWSGARRHINAALAQGDNLDAMLAGVHRYADYATAVGWAATEKVKQAETFFSQRAYREEWRPPKNSLANGHQTKYDRSREEQARKAGMTLEELDDRRDF